MTTKKRVVEVRQNILRHVPMREDPRDYYQKGDFTIVREDGTEEDATYADYLRFGGATAVGVPARA